LSLLIAIVNDKYLYIPGGKKGEKIEGVSRAKAELLEETQGRGHLFFFPFSPFFLRFWCRLR